MWNRIELRVACYFIFKRKGFLESKDDKEIRAKLKKALSLNSLSWSRFYFLSV